MGPLSILGVDNIVVSTLNGVHNGIPNAELFCSMLGGALMQQDGVNYAILCSSLNDTTQIPVYFINRENQRHIWCTETEARILGSSNDMIPGVFYEEGTWHCPSVWFNDPLIQPGEQSTQDIASNSAKLSLQTENSSKTR